MSVTENFTFPSSRAAERVMDPPAGVNLTALPTRLERICCTRAGSARTGGEICRGVHRECQRLVAGDRLEHFLCVLQQIVDARLAQRDRQPARLDGRDAKEILDQVIHPLT